MSFWKEYSGRLVGLGLCAIFLTTLLVSYRAITLETEIYYDDGMPDSPGRRVYMF